MAAHRIRRVSTERAALALGLDDWIVWNWAIRRRPVDDSARALKALAA